MNWPQNILVVRGTDSCHRILGFFSLDAEDEACGDGFNKRRLERHKSENDRHDLPENIATVVVAGGCQRQLGSSET